MRKTRYTPGDFQQFLTEINSGKRAGRNTIRRRHKNENCGLYQE
jgi:hypothetical protein